MEGQVCRPESTVQEQVQRFPGVKVQGKDFHLSKASEQQKMEDRWVISNQESYVDRQIREQRICNKIFW
jgi:hypothetical protein